ncbi:hypothetical protein SCARR_01175 [Pontiella sulfatireligans]|uniref:Uncharacterized protein n=1 Tax=Pontiella sulfatireligans TaxID=2750658 RepID=A0A6C2UGR8_9BACT|nr:hypothetical protein SCARR_01175 [Pontiella sulfatireligans]
MFIAIYQDATRIPDAIETVLLERIERFFQCAHSETV